jgi:hypothetical protein
LTTAKYFSVHRLGSLYSELADASRFELCTAWSPAISEVGNLDGER